MQLKRYFSTTLACVFYSMLVSDVSAGDQAPSIEFIGKAIIPGDARDLSGDTRILENGEPRNRLGGFSALDYSGKGTRYAAMSDRGADDGAVGYPCRVQMLDIDIQPGAQEPVSAMVAETILFRDANNRPFIGLAAAIEATGKNAHRFDPEGFRFNSAGGFFVSDEYGPVIVEFHSSGVEKRRFDLPAHLLVASPNADKVAENAANKTGRASNRGMECLALSTDGTKLVGLIQGPLLQDGQRTPEGIVIGRNCRLIEIELASGKTREFVYQMASDLNGNSEIVAVAPDRFLVLERDSGAGEAAAWRKLVMIDLSGATDVSDQITLPQELPASMKPVQRVDYLGFLDPRWKLAGTDMPEKIEGLTYGPALPDGRKTLLVSTDNDFESAEPSQIWVFAIDESASSNVRLDP